jgi:hypothetical protein
VISPARQAELAAGAALVASAGDLLLLYVANAQRAEAGLPEAGEAPLWIGGALGVVAIPFYALGYLAASRVVAGVSARASRALLAAGAAVALLGSVIHGLTAVHISAEVAAAAPVRDPLALLVGSDPLLLVLWCLAALAVAGASALFAWSVARGGTLAPRGAALANPALVTIALAALGMPSVLLRAFLTPAAPNLAHFVFFFVCSRVLRSGRIQHGARAG